MQIASVAFVEVCLFIVSEWDGFHCLTGSHTRRQWRIYIDNFWTCPSPSPVHFHAVFFSVSRDNLAPLSHTSHSFFYKTCWRKQWRMCIVTFWRHPDRSNFLHFHEVFWKFWPNNRLMSRFLGWRPPLGNPGSAYGFVSSRRSRCARDALPSQSNLFISMQFSAKIVPNNSLASPSWIGAPFCEILDPPLVSIWEILDPGPHSRSTLFLHFHRLLGKTGQMIFWHHPSAWAPIPFQPLRNPGTSIGDTSSLPNHASVTPCKRKENFVLKQERIPVGCVPSAAVAASGSGAGICVCLGGVCLECLLGGVYLWGKGGLPGGSA